MPGHTMKKATPRQMEKLREANAQLKDRAKRAEKRVSGLIKSNKTLSSQRATALARVEAEKQTVQGLKRQLRAAKKSK